MLIVINLLLTLCVYCAAAQAEAELDALRAELQQQQADLARRAVSLAAAAKEGAAQVSLAR